jgi:hypothetical protein
VTIYYLENISLSTPSPQLDTTRMLSNYGTYTPISAACLRNLLIISTGYCFCT